MLILNEPFDNGQASLLGADKDNILVIWKKRLEVSYGKDPYY